MINAALFAAYLACVPLANWMIGHVGDCSGQGPCLLPVGFGLLAPSGVILAGLSLVLRDMVQRAFGLTPSIVAIAIGTAFSFVLAPGAIVWASCVAFAASELADLAVYTPLRKRALAVSLVASGLVGAVVDSALFLTIAFGSQHHLAGQVLGKMWGVADAAIVFSTLRRTARRH